MSNNRINNNDEIIRLIKLECMVRVYLELEGDLMRFTIGSKMVKLLAELDKMRGFKFDTKASAEQLLAEINAEHDNACKHEYDYINNDGKKHCLNCEEELDT